MLEWPHETCLKEAETLAAMFRQRREAGVGSVFQFNSNSKSSATSL